MACLLASGLHHWPEAWAHPGPPGSRVVGLALGPGHLVLGRASGQVEAYSRGEGETVTLVWAKVRRLPLHPTPSTSARGLRGW